jgi:hypothetical protein
MISNVGTELLGRRAPERYLRLRYEDFVDRPQDLCPEDRRVVTGLTWPLLERYGYAISAGADA